MGSRYRVSAPEYAHFVTCSIVEWLPVFTTGARCEIIAQALDYCRQQKNVQVHAWVILDNHFHAVLSAPELPRTLADLKRHAAKQILAQLQKDGADWLLNQLHFYRSEHRLGNAHQIWQEGSHPQQVSDDTMMQQKIDYIHANPVKRGLVSAPEHWRYSSAHAWLPGAVPPFRCDPWR